MSRNNHQLLWLMLPAVLVVLYFVIIRPGPGPAPATTTAENIIDTAPVQVNKTDTPADVVNNDEPRQESSSANQQDQEVAQDREFINYAFPVLSRWNLEEVKPLLADATIAASSDEEIDEVMSVLENRLGDLKYFETPQPVATDVAPDQTDGKLQHYQFVAYYEAGEAEVNLVLHKQREDNSLYSFNIHVPN